MPTTLTWLGHNAWSLDCVSETTGDGTKVLIDPFLNDSPTAPVKAEDVEADYLVLSHGHGDHLGDTVAIAKRTGATVLTAYEISLWLAGQGVPADHVVGMNPGGGYELISKGSGACGRVKMTAAHHSSSLPDGTYAGVAMGLEITTGGKRLYFACDTSLFADMQLIGDADLNGSPLDLAVLPIGDLFTMGPADSVIATKLLRPAKVLPCHYNTFPPIEQDAAAWAEEIRKRTDAEPIVLEPGGSITL
ncbi:metal-dependent hydrolase [Planctomycetes bacterium MalM25]|nr:metal-dependent hydrolase [Planctomycetes bacterium MalM25]